MDQAHTSTFRGNPSGAQHAAVEHLDLPTAVKLSLTVCEMLINIQYSDAMETASVTFNVLTEVVRLRCSGIRYAF